MIWYWYKILLYIGKREQIIHAICLAYELRKHDRKLKIGGNNI